MENSERRLYFDKNKTAKNPPGSKQPPIRIDQVHEHHEPHGKSPKVGIRLPQKHWIYKYMRNELLEFSGGKQGNAPKPVTKIQGTQHLQRVEKIRQIPVAQPKSPNSPKWANNHLNKTRNLC